MPNNFIANLLNKRASHKKMIIIFQMILTKGAIAIDDNLL